MAEDPMQRNGVPLKKRTCRHLPALQLGVHITVERELSLINEPQSGKRSYRFCHRGGLEQRIALNFHAAAARNAEAMPINDLAAVDDSDAYPRDFPSDRKSVVAGKSVS